MGMRPRIGTNATDRRGATSTWAERECAICTLSSDDQAPPRRRQRGDEPSVSVRAGRLNQDERERAAEEREEPTSLKRLCCGDKTGFLRLKITHASKIEFYIDGAVEAIQKVNEDHAATRLWVRE